MSNTPPSDLILRIHQVLSELLSDNPAASSSEAYMQNSFEFAMLTEDYSPRYFVRIGINYHGKSVQQLQVDSATGILKGWNRNGDALGTSKKAKMLLANHTIFKRDNDEPMMNDSKIGGGSIQNGVYIRMEFKARGWLGKTKNLAGEQLEKDLDLLKADQADILVICLSETAHLKWIGKGPEHQVKRRTGLDRFKIILIEPSNLLNTQIVQRNISFEGQPWSVSSQRVIGLDSSIMPGAEHIITICWRTDSI